MGGDPYSCRFSKGSNKGGQLETFGQIIASERRVRRLGLKNIAEQSIKADGHPISVGYLDNLEKGLHTSLPELTPNLLGRYNFLQFISLALWAFFLLTFCVIRLNSCPLS